MSQAENNSNIIKELASKFGFSECGLSKSERLNEAEAGLKNWLELGYQGEMDYLNRNTEKRLNPEELVPGTKTIVSLMYNYYPAEFQSEDSYKISYYAYGEDYHKVVKDQCYLLFEAIRENLGDVKGRVFVDSAPVMERIWAEKSGIGWIGKNGLIINKNKGSYFFLAELFLDIECLPDSPTAEFCGTCTKCIDACPTEAILPGKKLNAVKCLSYQTIELKSDKIEDEFIGKTEDYIYGCDICQVVCPWNRFSVPTHEPRFQINPLWKDKDNQDWSNLTEIEFGVLFEKSAVQRAGFKGLKRNISAQTKNKLE